MTNPFSEAYCKLCIENAEKLREEWEKRGLQIGDWYIETKRSSKPWGYIQEDGEVVSRVCFELMPEEYGEVRGEPVFWEPNPYPMLIYASAVEQVHGMGGFDKDEKGKTPLFQPRQIIEMIKKQGWWLAGLHERPDGSWYVEAGRKPKEFEWAECRAAEGPDPETALLKCLLEVMGKDEAV